MRPGKSREAYLLAIAAICFPKLRWDRQQIEARVVEHRSEARLILLVAGPQLRKPRFGQFDRFRYRRGARVLEIILRVFAPRMGGLIKRLSACGFEIRGFDQ